jgi:peptidoglycan/LPS O-acetylase OafA/YrhL
VVFFCGQRRLMIICAACFLGSLGVRLGLAIAGNSLAAYVLTPARMDTLAVGALLAILIRRPDGIQRLAQWMWPIGGASAAGLVAIFVWQHGLRELDIIVQTIGYSMLAVTFGALLIVALSFSSGSLSGKIFAHPVLAFFGRYSYALYVFHHPIVVFMKQSLLGESGRPIFLGSKLPAQLLSLTVATGASVSGAWISWHFYEAQFLKLKVLFPYQPTLVLIKV